MRQFYMNKDYSLENQQRGELKYPFDKMKVGDFIEPEILL